MASVFTYRMTHPDNEVNLVTLDYQKTFSPRGKSMTKTVTMSLFGELTYDTSAALITAATNVINAYSQDYGDAKFLIDGVPAHQLLNSGDCISGVRVVGTSFPKNDPDELATVRSFAVTLRATYDACEDDLLSWQESVETIGDGGPLTMVIDTVSGPYQLTLAPTTAVRYIQTGKAIGYAAWPVAPGPVNPAGNEGRLRRIRRTSARNMGTQLRYYTTSWSYYMGRDVATFGAADFFPTSK